MSIFTLKSPFKPAGDQPKAIQALTDGFPHGKQFQTLLGVTGSGKTFTIAHLIKNLGIPTLVISHNKTLAAQLYFEFKEFFPQNAVEYFVSYYDYYQPEAYIPQTDTYIEKDSSINDRIDRLRLSATSSLMSRKDVIVVASVSCIYNLGSPDDYRDLLVFMERGERISIHEVMHKLVNIQYERNDMDFSRGDFRLRGDVLEIFPAYLETAYRIQWSDDQVESICQIDPLTGKVLGAIERIGIYPAKHFVTTPEKIERASCSIEQELQARLTELKAQQKMVEAERLLRRTRYDMEMLKEIGYCNGVENYSRHLSGRPIGSRPGCLLDYFQGEFLTVIDESHVTIPQINGMYNGDKARKDTLVDYGFRLPSCLDNRPLRFEEFESMIGKTVFVSATPAEYEMKKSAGIVVEQVIRPTGLVDPQIMVRPTEGQIDDLVKEITQRAQQKERVLVTTLTKRLAEDLTSYLKGLGLRVSYLHSEIDTLERVKILRDLRRGDFDCLIGINLLREGLDLPEVSLVAVLDADKEGFLRSETSLIQVSGRAARNVHGQVIMYADTTTHSMQRAIDETSRRRKIQLAYNQQHHITPQSIVKEIKEGLAALVKAQDYEEHLTGQGHQEYLKSLTLAELEQEMELAARNLQFEKAAVLRDKLIELETKDSSLFAADQPYLLSSRKSRKKKKTK